MKILVLGGSMFVGWHIVHEALHRGHTVTTFNRGITHPDRFPGIDKIRGDRNTQDIQQIRRQTWDAVIDSCGYDAETVRLSVSAAAEHADRYIFISSLGAYKHRGRPGQDETAEVALPGEMCTPVLPASHLASYPPVLDHGPRKTACEQVVQTFFSACCLILRLGLVVGPYDHTDRFTYWPARIANGGDVLAPGNPDALVQFIDGRDLARFVIEMTERRATGTFNIAGPEQPVRMADFFAVCKELSNSDARFHWTGDTFLLANQIKMYTEMPLWIAALLEGINQFNTDKAKAAGLVHRPLVEVVRDVLSWHRSRGENYILKAGISAEREAHLLRKFAADRESPGSKARTA
ncbi:MAG TPA: NAD-dependent epimerase/dehydratase family protein [Candidatus Angelobacter sp.]|nr:NAD-dependent epimerase/dehydratase family protein [Candidatus Angelobacter sp.]